MRATTALARHPSPLPVVLTPLLGRAREAGQIRELVTDPANRLVTITGPGGVGKTRLALHIASTLTEVGGDAIAYVPLAAIRDPTLVVPAILQAFGVFSDAQDAPEDQVVDLLQDHQVLLVLDNLEQVLDAAASLVNVLARCPRVTMLITSQAALGIPGEHLYPLQPLPTPTSEETTVDVILQSDAVALFVQRARSVKPNLAIDERAATTIAELCRRLDGLPLAIELAAARTSILSPDALLARLGNRLQVLGGERRGVPDRLRTMRNAVAWSYDLLTAEEQALFRRMAVFVGDLSLEAVEAIFPPTGERDPFDILSALVTHSLVQAIPLPTGEARFLMLETLRDYGLEQLALAQEGHDARLAHAMFFVDLTEAAEPHLIGRDQEAWLDRLDPESENLRAAAGWALTSGHEEIALLIGAASWRFCATHGLASDCREWLERALAAGSTQHSPSRARALVGVGNLFEDMRDMDKARTYFEQAREIAASTGNTVAESQALLGLGLLAHDTGSYAEAFDLHTKATELARASGDQHCIARALGNLGAVSYFQGRLDDAERYWEESRMILSSLGDIITEASATSNLGALAFDRADLARAEQMQRRALDLQRKIKSTRDIPYTLINLAGVAVLQGDHTLAHDCLAEAVTLLRQYGHTAIEGVALNVAAGLALAEGKPRDAASLVLESTRLVAEAGDQRAIIENAEVLAEACSAHGNHTAAVELLAAAARGRREIGADLTPLKVAEIERIETAVRAALSADDYASAQRAGDQLDVDALTRRIAILARAIVGPKHTLEIPIVTADATEIAEPAVEHNLTAREAEILRLLAEGQSTREISETLFISPRTASTHIANILGKLEVTSRTAAVAYAMRTGIA